MTVDTDLMHEHAEVCRRRAFLEGVVGVALLFVAIVCGLRSETWHGIVASLAAGGFLSAAVFTFIHGRHWARTAAKREASPSQSWPSPNATKGEG